MLPSPTAAPTAARLNANHEDQRPASERIRLSFLLTGFAGCLRVQHYGAVTGDEHTVLGMPAHGVVEHDRLDVVTDLDEIRRLLGVIDALYVLLDDRPFIEVHGRIVRGGADDLHAALVCLVVRLGAFESRQERMMDVDA